MTVFFEISVRRSKYCLDFFRWPFHSCTIFEGYLINSLRFCDSQNSQSVLSGLKPDNRNRSFLKQYVKILNKNAIFLDVFTGCFESFKNERFQPTKDFTITASSELTSHIASYSRLYGTDGWCSSSVSLPQYLQADFGQIVTVTGVATQGDKKRDNRVTSFLIRYGYDGKTWISYGAWQVNLQHVFVYLSGFA